MKVLTTILALLIGIISVLPCCPTDSCTDEKSITEQNAPDDHTQEGEVCSPFYSCAACIGFTLAGPSIAEAVFEATKPLVYTRQPASFFSSFHHAIWQPPKIG
ncbi:DUF6660 family protein [Pontibacter locisalis]|uniref:DUF6660 family protein n=1 Tax=Pontibacter locisalis TaxID=1719035 RepID=A0ABW5IJA3_9BACT